MPDYYSHVPKDLEGNLAYRLEVRRRAAVDRKFRKALVQASAEDVLYFFNTFCWLHEPRDLVIDGYQQPHVIPFITRRHQDAVILAIFDALGKADIGVEKARGEGMSWIMVLLALHGWLFQGDVTIGMCSATEDKSDIPDNRGTLLGKLDWQVKSMLPTWLVGTYGRDWIRNRTDHTLTNLRRANQIVAYSATAGTGRGDRYWWFLLDELGEWPSLKGDEVLASLQHATESRVYVSTPMGPTGTYYDVMHRPSNMRRVVLDWKDNPSRNRGMYRLVNNKPVVIDPDNPLPPEYCPPSSEIVEMYTRLRQNGFKLEGKERSPWYDRECDRSGSTPQKVARELDRDFAGSVVQFFAGDFFEAVDGTIRQPRHVGRLVVDDEDLANLTYNWEEVNGGEFSLWCELDGRGRPPKGDYCLGVDVSSGIAGSHTSNSTVEVFDVATREQVGEWAANWVEPVRFAGLCLGICRWFWDAFLIWEINYGAGFTSRVVQSNYPHLYQREILDRRTKRITKKFGWNTTKDSKLAAFDDFKFAVKHRGVVLRSRQLVQECMQYVVLNGVPEHAGSKRSVSTDGMTHGDLVIGAALANQVLKKRPVVTAASGEKIPLKIPPNCLAARMREAEMEDRQVQDVWDGRTNWDLVR